MEWQMQHWQGQILYSLSLRSESENIFSFLETSVKIHLHSASDLPDS